MSVWKYTAVDLRSPVEARTHTGELAGATAADVRASLRRIGLQVVDLRLARLGNGTAASAGGTDRSRAPPLKLLRRSLVSSVRSAVRRYVQMRRRLDRAELYDSLATMLASGAPLLEAIETLIDSTKRRRSALRCMLIQVQEDLRSGSSFSQAMRQHPMWFNGAEIAMVRAGHHSGTLIEVLQRLSERHERTGELSNRLAGALAYPAIVAMVGLGVAVFLSVKTLPSLSQVLADGGIETPMLTSRVMAFGQFVAAYWPVIAVVILGGLVALAILPAMLERLGVTLPRWSRRLRPKVVRRVMVARMSLQLAELLRTGVPMVEALRVLAPTTGSGGLRRCLVMAADRVERGDDLSAALDDEHWFDAEYRRLLDIGQASGELEDLLDRLGHRHARHAKRLIDRMTTVLEPAVILTLAILVGVVVMAAVLPLLRLQEIL